ncbi:hypothetical protein AYO22_02727 [Fonsecaea multimorphosa]|nr:hypothetical protein AYO22_02727 [Fonsecaea multimorphosa]
MSTTSSSQPLAFPPVAVSSTHPQQSLRLLELPAELLDVVEAQIKNPSKRRKLWFKSSRDIGGSGPTQGQRLPGGSNRGINSQAAAAGGGEGKEGFLHLCTDDKIWAVKQVSTSNSVYVTQTCPPQKQGGGGGDNDKDGTGDTPMAGAEEQANVVRLAMAVAAGSRGGITTKAQVKNVLELIEVKADEREIERRVYDMVPVYHDVEDDNSPLDQGHQGGMTRHEAVSTRDVVDNIAAPTRLIRDVMRKSFIFGLPQPTTRKGERHDEDMVYLPTPALLLRHWKDFLQQCNISGIHLEKNDNVLSGKDLRAVLDGLAEAEETEAARSLALNVTMAILRRFTDGMEDADVPMLLNLGLSLYSPDHDRLLSDARLKFNPSLTREMVGRWLLACHARRKSSSLSNTSSDISSHGAGRTMRVDEFLTEWTQLLPDSWAAECDLTSLISSVDGADTATDGQGVQVLRFEAAGSLPHPLATSSAAAVGSTTLAKDAQNQNQNQKKRKWHEKFGAQRSIPAVKR